ncbi:MAG: hypothetical protein M3Z65_07060 [Chloroflexota bacterium]|nr:hypothetical protein [Chloroflexota bacterium]
MAATAVATVLFLGILYVVRGQSPITTAFVQPGASAPVTAAPSLTQAASATTTAAGTAAPASPTPTPTQTGTYVNATYKYSLTLPLPYRQSARLSVSNTGGQNPAAVVALDAFTARSESDEAGLPAQICDASCPLRSYVAEVEIYTGVSQTPRQWYTSHGGQSGERIDDVTIDGRTAIRVTNGAPAYMPVQVILKDGDRILHIAYEIWPNTPVPTGGTAAKLDQILASFRFLP